MREGKSFGPSTWFHNQYWHDWHGGESKGIYLFVQTAHF